MDKTDPIQGLLAWSGGTPGDVEYLWGEIAGGDTEHLLCDIVRTALEELERGGWVEITGEDMDKWYDAAEQWLLDNDTVINEAVNKHLTTSSK